MNLSATEEKLMAAMGDMRIIDAHEHLPPETVRTAQPQDVFTLFSHYTRHDLYSAGMDRDRGAAEDRQRPAYNSLFDRDRPLDERWRTFKPYWNAIRHGSYARAAILTAQKVYGVDDIGDNTYAILSERIAAANRPGIYHTILTERCGIEAALTQCSRTDVAPPLVPLMPAAQLTDLTDIARPAAMAEFAGAGEPQNLEDWRTIIRAVVAKWIDAGCVGLKMHSRRRQPRGAGDPEAAFRQLRRDGRLANDSQAARDLGDALTHEVADIAADLDLVVAVHAGIWGDFRELDAKDMLTFAPAHPRTNFDLYHLGMPFVRDTIVVAKNLPNVFLNLCWTHIVSPAQTRSGVDELLDQVPINKIIAFGGDYARPVEKVVGHLHLARENFAQVFGARIDRRLMSIREAVDVLKLWFYDNPKRLYTRLPNPTANPTGATGS